MTKPEDETEARVEEAVEAVRRERTSTDELALPQDTEPPIELEAPPPRPEGTFEPEPEPPPPAETSLRRKRMVIALVVLVLIAAGIYVGIGLTPEGEELLPAEARTRLLEGGDDLERKARDVTGVERAYYRFTDDEGVVHIVDELEKVPAKYRKRAKKMD